LKHFGKVNSSFTQKQPTINHGKELDQTRCVLPLDASPNELAKDFFVRRVRELPKDRDCGRSSVNCHAASRLPPLRAITEQKNRVFSQLAREPVGFPDSKTAAGLSEPVPERELHPLESSSFHGAL
jgi:hypothetical protein